MPKDIFTPRQLPREQPDRCELCPLLGLIPKDERRKGKRERYFCLGIYEAETDEMGDPVLDETACNRCRSLVCRRSASPCRPKR